MKLHRFFTAFKENGNMAEVADPEVINQITKVLRKKIGDMVVLVRENMDFTVQINKIGKNEMLVKIIEKEQNQNKPKINVSLFCAVLKKENFELVVQKATEIGISEIIPIITERTIKTKLNMERMRKIAKEASEQSERGEIPKIHEPVSFRKSLEIAKGKNIIFDRSGELIFKIPWERDGVDTRNFSVEKYPSILKIDSQNNIWIGPEGGWTENEINKAKNLNFEMKSLGKTTLRAETAAIVATYALLSI